MYYDTVVAVARYVTESIAVVIMLVVAIKIAAMWRINSRPKDISSTARILKVNAGLLHQIERVQSSIVVASYVIIVQFLVTVSYCANLISRAIVGVLAVKVCTPDALAARLSHVYQVLVSGLWTTIVLSIINILLVILIRQRKSYWKALVDKHSSPMTESS
jgi:hypothetical protein